MPLSPAFNHFTPPVFATDQRVPHTLESRWFGDVKHGGLVPPNDGSYWVIEIYGYYKKIECAINTKYTQDVEHYIKRI